MPRPVSTLIELSMTTELVYKSRLSVANVQNEIRKTVHKLRSQRLLPDKKRLNVTSDQWALIVNETSKRLKIADLDLSSVMSQTYPTGDSDPSKSGERKGPISFFHHLGKKTK